MQFPTLTSILALTATAAAQSSSTWHVTSYTTSSASAYTFSIASTDSNPSFGGTFQGSCTGNIGDSTVTACNVIGLAAKVSGGTLSVQRSFLYGSGTQFVSGSVATGGEGEF